MDFLLRPNFKKIPVVGVREVSVIKQWTDHVKIYPFKNGKTTFSYPFSGPYP